MPQQETTLLRIPREGFVTDLELRVTHRKRGVHVREWWLPSSSENFVPTSKGIAIHPGELDAVIAALTEAKRLLEQTRMPRQREELCPRCQSPEARQNRQAGAASGALPSDYYCGLCGAVEGSLRKSRP